MKTAVEFLASVLSQAGPITRDDFDSLVEQALEMEKEEKIEFAKHFLYKCKDLSIVMAYNQVEQELIKYELTKQQEQ
jgi:hypothetical protein